MQDLQYLEHALQRTLGKGKRADKFQSLNRAICEIVEDFGLVSFETLAVEDKESMFHLLGLLDKATGYIYAAGYDPDAANAPEDMALYEPGSLAATANLGNAERAKTAASAAALFTVADTGSTAGWGGPLEVQERWIDHRKEWDDWEDERAEKQGQRLADQKVLDAARKHLSRT